MKNTDGREGERRDAREGESVCQMCCSVLQCVAVCCSVLQCVAVCCRVLPWEKEETLEWERDVCRIAMCATHGWHILSWLRWLRCVPFGTQRARQASVAHVTCVAHMRLRCLPCAILSHVCYTWLSSFSLGCGSWLPWLPCTRARVCVRVCACLCVCVCVRERERECVCVKPCGFTHSLSL